MSGWVRFESDAWPMVADALSKPWPKEAAAFDLRWHQDRKGSLNGRPYYRERWGWTDWAVKSLFRDEATWSDPLRQPTASRPPADRQRTASRKTGKPTQSPESRQPTASEPPASRQPTATGAMKHTTHAPTQEQVAPPALALVPSDADPDGPTTIEVPDDFAEVLEAWNAAVAPVVGCSEHRRLSPRRGLGQPLAARLREHGKAAVLRVFRWYAKAGERAAYLREQRHELKTLLRPANFDEYAAMAEAWEREGGRAEARAGPSYPTSPLPALVVPAAPPARALERPA
jgi:hypothetical protein